MRTLYHLFSRRYTKKYFFAGLACSLLIIVLLTTHAIYSTNIGELSSLPTLTIVNSKSNNSSSSVGYYNYDPKTDSAALNHDSQSLNQDDQDDHEQLQANEEGYEPISKPKNHPDNGAEESFDEDGYENHDQLDLEGGREAEKETLEDDNSKEETLNNAQNLKAFYTSILKEIKDYSPEGTLDRTKGSDCKIGDIGATNIKDFGKLSESELSKCIQIPKDTSDMLKDLHTRFYETVKTKILPSFNSIEAPYKGEGIVIVGGGKFSLIGLPAIKAIRVNSGHRLQSSIPVEIMIPPSDDEDVEFCKNVLPKVDPTGLTRCVFFSDIFEEEILKDIKGYQLKALALLVSSFRKVLMLDADNYVVNSIENFFDSPVFNEKGLVLWPDFWRRLHHPKFYEIIGIDVNRKKSIRYSIDNVTPSEVYRDNDDDSIPFHDLANSIPDISTESGQLLVDKQKHLDTLLLSCYYNYNGPSFYYPLLGQGYAGEGDKDTFIAAAHVTHPSESGSYYQIQTPVRVQGHWCDEFEISIGDNPDDILAEVKNKKYRGVAMLQSNYIEDHEKLKEAQSAIPKDIKKRLDKFRQEHKDEFNNEDDLYKKFYENLRGHYSLNDYLEYFDSTEVSFIHSHLPKYDPWVISQDEDFKYDGKRAKKLRGDKDSPSSKLSGHYRIYNSAFPKVTNYDLELANWAVFQEFLCSGDKENYKNFKYLKTQVSKADNPTVAVENMCKYIDERVEFLRKTTWEFSIQ